MESNLWRPRGQDQEEGVDCEDESVSGFPTAKSVNISCRFARLATGNFLSGRLGLIISGHKISCEQHKTSPSRAGGMAREQVTVDEARRSG